MPPTREQLIAQVKALVKEGAAIFVREMDKQKSPTSNESAQKRATTKAAKSRDTSNTETPAIQQPFKAAYQSWYTRSLPVVKLVLPDRYAEFIEQYKLEKRKEIDFLTYTISDYLIGLQVTRGTTQVVNALSALSAKFQHQILILQSCSDRLESSLSDIQGVLRAELFDDELSAATELLRKGHLRAAGALAGVTLERHLASVASRHSIKLAKRDPTIADINEALKKDNVLDIPSWRSIQRFADLRNIAVHNKSREPTSDEIEELIRGVERTIKTLF